MNDQAERLLAIERLCEQIRQLTESATLLQKRIGAAQRSNRTMIGGQNTVAVIHDLVSESANALVEISQLTKQLDRAKETYARDYPTC